MRDWIILYVLLTVIFGGSFIGIVLTIVTFPAQLREWRAILRDHKETDA